MITGTQKEIDRILPFMTGRLQKALAAVRDLDLETLPLGKTIICLLYTSDAADD